MTSQQEKLDQLFLKREEERRRKEMELEEKRRKEDQQHDLMMMQMMGNMFKEMVASINKSYVAPTQNFPPFYPQQSHFQPQPRQASMNQQPANNYNVIEEQNNGSTKYYTNLLPKK